MDPEQLTIDVEADATVGYAAIQNAVPIVRALRVTNKGDVPLDGVEVVVRCEPSFARGAKLRFERLEPGESRRVAPLDLVPDHAFLADHVESVVGAIVVTATQRESELFQVARPLEILAYDQWAGTRALPELLAAFCMPNNPAIDALLGRASALLRTHHPDLSMDGYQSKHRDRVWKQVSAIYSTIASEGLQYSEPPASFGSDGQKIRTPDRILEGRVATCLDLAMLFGSCLEQAGLRPIVLMKQGHAWVGVWLHEAAFATAVVDDVLAVRKRVDAGELLVFETTGVAQHASVRPSLRNAAELGARHLADAATFGYAIDVQRARQLKIRPLPSRAVGGTKRLESPETHEPIAIEPTPSLPPLDPLALAAQPESRPETPEDRLAHWKGKLLDLTLRNKLLNFRATKSSLQLVAPELAVLEDALFDRKEFRIREMPAMMTGADPREAEVHVGRHGTDPLIEHARERLAQGEIICRVQADKLEGHLVALYRDARTGLEEGGSNTLYLALGFLRWVETEHAEATHLAPILLVPVTLQRASVLSGFRLGRHDDETIVNPTLLQMLRQTHELKIAGLDPVPMDDKGVDVARVLQIFRLAVVDLPRWEVVEDAFLGIFSFTKYLMWKDLNDRSEQLKANRVVRHLIDRPGEAISPASEGEGAARLDDTHGPADLLAPLLCDSSQLEAMREVDDGHDLVLEGPPGTGKSQTITNLIAHLVGKSKTVLFVSEKMTALDVVHRRLNEIGLGPFCLELHSAKARKLEVLGQLGEAMDARAGFDEAVWTREADRLSGLRRELNTVVDALHEIHRNGLTVFDAIGTCIAGSGRPLAQMSWADPGAHTRDDLDSLRELARRIAALAADVGDLWGNPLAEIGQSEWSYGWQDAFAAAIERTEVAAQAMQEAAPVVAGHLPLTAAGASIEALAAFDSLADVLLRAPKLPGGLARRAGDPGAQWLLGKLSAHAASRTQQWASLGGAWRDELAKLDAADLQREWASATSKWWPSGWFAKRAVSTRLAALRTDAARPSAADIAGMLPILAAVNAEDRALAALDLDAHQLLGEVYAGTNTDWPAVGNLDAWSRGFSDAVARTESTDATARQGLRQRLEPLVAEQRHLLAPDGPLGQSIVAFRRAYHELDTELRALAQLACVDGLITGPAGADGAIERLRTTLARWRGATRSLQPWCLWRDARGRAMTQNLAGLVGCLERGDVALAEAESLFERSYREWWLKRTIDQVPTLRVFSSSDHQRKIREFRDVDERFQKLTRAFVVARLCGKLPMPTPTPAATDSEMGLLQRERQKQRRHLPVRQLVAGLPTLLPRLKPCLLMSPLSVAQYLDARHAQFDVVVFDEASQIPVWDAVGAIARGKQVVVVGDPKQLPPTNFFERTTSADAADEDESVEDLESILDECIAIGLDRRSLQWHYRSRHESLIHFSNVTYYGSRLITFPSPTTEHAGVRCEQVVGTYDRGGSRTNRAEANAIVGHIERHFAGADGASSSVGVVTFNAPQQDLIETLLDARRKENPDLDRAIAAATREPLFIKNLEGVQGDERDIILFSTTYGPDAAGKMTMNFGPLNRDGGQRRLNVAVSRARHSVVVFSTMRPDDIELARASAAGVRDLKAYLEYAIRGPRALVERSLPTGREPDSPFESAVISALRERGWEVHPQVGCSGYRIDLGVVDPRARGRYLLGIECDGRAYHSGATARDRDRLRQHVLEGLGWKLQRIWSTDWWRDPGRELQRLGDVLQALLQIEPEAASELPATAVPREAEAASQLQMPPPPEATRLPIYEMCLLPTRDSAGFEKPSADAILRGQIAQVIAREGPVLDTVVFRRVAKAWDKRLGARILDRIASCVPPDVVVTREGGRTFYWPSGTKPDDWRAFRIADATEESRRSVDEICTPELENMLVHALTQNGRCAVADVIRIVCGMFGVGRVSAEMEARVRDPVDRMVGRGVLREQDGYITLA